MKIPKAVKSFLEKMDCEGGLGGMIEYGVEDDVKAIAKVDEPLAQALAAVAAHYHHVNELLERYED